MLPTAFILGLAGSLHCAGMCSPLAFAITNLKKSVWVNRLLYNVGRILMYGILGTVVSTIGVALPFEKIQTSLSICMGTMLIMAGLIGNGQLKFSLLSRWMNRLSSILKNKFSFFTQRKNTFSIFLLGAINGLLPCGLSFMALSTCLIVPSVRDGFYFMLMFGAGTLPVMIGFLSFVRYLINSFHLSFHRVNTVMLIAAGVLLITRGVITKPHPDPLSTSSGIEVCR